MDSSRWTHKCAGRNPIEIMHKPTRQSLALHSLIKGLDASSPDRQYTKPGKQVFCEATVAVSKQDGHLQFLYHVSSPSRLPELQSWVLDWHDS